MLDGEAMTGEISVRLASNGRARMLRLLTAWENAAKSQEITIRLGAARDGSERAVLITFGSEDHVLTEREARAFIDMMRDVEKDVGRGMANATGVPKLCNHLEKVLEVQ